MKRARLVIKAMLLGAGALVLVSAQAQQPQPASQPHAGLQNPIRHSLMTVFALPEMQAELGLSPQQTAQLRQFKQELLARGKEASAQIATKQKELEALLDPDTSKGVQVKTLFEQIGNLRAQQHFAAYEAARKMKGVLTEDQKTKLAAMKPAERRQAMMSHLSMADTVEMMQFMGGGMGMMEMMGLMGGG